MQAWAEDQGIAGTMVSFVADPNAVLVDALGMELTNPGEVNVLGPKRSKRFAAYIDDSVIKVFRTSEAEDDPAGGDDPSGTCYSSMVEAIQSVRSSADAEL